MSNFQTLVFFGENVPQHCRLEGGGGIGREVGGIGREVGGIARERVQGGREGEFFSITTGNWFSRKQCRKLKIYRSIFIITFTNICLELQLSLRRKRN